MIYFPIFLWEKEREKMWFLPASPYRTLVGFWWRPISCMNWKFQLNLSFSIGSMYLRRRHFDSYRSDRDISNWFRICCVTFKLTSVYCFVYSWFITCGKYSYKFYFASWLFGFAFVVVHFHMFINFFVWVGCYFFC